MSPATHSAGMKLKLKQVIVISLFWLSSSIAASIPAPGASTRGSSPLRLSKGFKPHSPSPAAITNMAEFGTVADQAMLVHDIIDRARANDNVIAVEDTHRFGNYSMRDALSYIDAFMDKGEAQIMWPKSDGGLVKRTCEGADGIGTLDAHGSWWVEFQIAGAQGCQQACGY